MTHTHTDDRITADHGGAHPWCNTCGWQQAHHTTRPDHGDDMNNRTIRQGNA